MNYRFLSILAIAAAMSAVCACKGNEDSLKMLVGTYTKGSESVGVYLLDYNQEDGSWALVDTAAAGNPSFVIPSGDRAFAYSVGEFADDRQCAYAYRLSDTAIDKLNSESAAGEASGATPCNIVIAGGCAITSNYRGGTLSAFPIKDDGSLGALVQQYVPENDNPDAVSHIHCAAISPDGKYLFATDLGLDRLYRSTIGDSSAPMQDPRIVWQFDSEVHPGPRHLVFSADGRFAYLVHELGDFLTVFSYHDGELEHVSTQLAYQGGGHGSADIHISPDGRYLYTSHRLKDDGISIFRINAEDGSATPAGYCRTGVHPRNFAITPNGKYLLCACRDSNAVEIYDINAEDGSLTFSGRSIDIPAPVCVSLYF